MGCGDLILCLTMCNLLATYLHMCMSAFVRVCVCSRVFVCECMCAGGPTVSLIHCQGAVAQISSGRAQL